MTVDSTAVGSDRFEYRKTVIRNRRGGVFGNIGGRSVVHASGIADHHRFRSVRRQKDGGHSYVSDDNPLRCVLGIHRRSFLPEVPGKDRISDIILCGVYDTMHSVVLRFLRVCLQAALRGCGCCRIGSFSFASGFDFTPLYGVEADAASALFRSFSLKICAANAFSLLLRIGFEFLRYTRNTRV